MGVKCNSIKNKSLLTGIYTLATQIQMCTNTGERVLEKRGILLGMDNNPWLDENLMANILRFGELANQYRITYDSEKTDCFYCYTQTGIIEFRKTKEGLYSTSLPEGYKDEVREYDN